MTSFNYSIRDPTMFCPNSPLEIGHVNLSLSVEKNSMLSISQPWGRGLEERPKGVGHWLLAPVVLSTIADLVLSLSRIITGSGGKTISAPSTFLRRPAPRLIERLSWMMSFVLNG